MSFFTSKLRDSAKLTRNLMLHTDPTGDHALASVYATAARTVARQDYQQYKRFGKLLGVAAGLLTIRDRQIVPTDTGCLLFPWVGDKTMNTLELLLGAQGLAVSNDGVSLNIRATEMQTRRASADLLRKGLPPAHTLAHAVENKAIGKYDEFLPEDLLAQSYASARLDTDSARDTLLALVDGAE